MNRKELVKEAVAAVLCCCIFVGVLVLFFYRITAE